MSWLPAEIYFCFALCEHSSKKKKKGHSLAYIFHHAEPFPQQKCLRWDFEGENGVSVGTEFRGLEVTPFYCDHQGCIEPHTSLGTWLILKQNLEFNKIQQIGVREFGKRLKKHKNVNIPINQKLHILLLRFSREKPVPPFWSN